MLTSAMLFMTACTPGSQSSPASANNNGHAGAATVETAKYAIYVSPPARELDPKKGNQGQVLLVNPDGASSSIPVGGMELGKVAWHEKELLYSDSSADYTLATGREAVNVPSTKSDNQVALFPDVVGKRVSIYNKGFAENGYISEVVTTSADSSTNIEVEGNYFIAAQCADSVYGLSRATGPYAVTNEPETEPMMLAKLTATKAGAEEVIGTSEVANEGAVVPDAPCADGKIRYISNGVESGVKPVPVVSTWDVKSGTYQAVKIVTDSHEKPVLREDGTGLPQLNAGSLQGESLNWFGSEDGIMQTNLKTGQTKRLFTVEGKTTDTAYSQVKFTHDKAIQLVDNGDGREIQIIEYELSSGKELSRVAISGLTNKLSADYQIFGFDARN